MIKLTDLNGTGRLYLNKNPEYSKQLVATLNQVNGFSPNQLAFYANSFYGIYDFGFSPHYVIDKKAFEINIDRIYIQSTNRDDLLNPHYYQHLNHLANNYPIEKGKGYYFAQDQVLQLGTYGGSRKPYAYLNIKLTKSIDQYNQNQLNVIGELLTNVHDLIIKYKKLDGNQFADQGKQGFANARSVGIVFDLNDFANSKILLRGCDENSNNRYENADLKQVLKADSELLKFLNNKGLPN